LSQADGEQNSPHREHTNSVSALFQAGGLAVVLVEVDRKHFLASIVPVIVNSVLNSHHFIVDIVAFVSKGDFPRSRLGEKQRGKILASWVTRKMRTIAQFAIRDPNGDDEAPGKRRGSVGIAPRASTGSGTLHSMGAGSLGSRGPPSGKLQPQQVNLPPELHSSPLRDAPVPGAALPPNEFHAELPTTYPQHHSIPELPAEDAAELDAQTPTGSPGGDRRPDQTAAPPVHIRVHDLSVRMSATNYSPVDPHGPFAPFTPSEEAQDYSGAVPHGDRPGSRGNEALVTAAQNLPGSLLPPAAIAELRGVLPHHVVDDDKAEDNSKPPPLPSYANKPYLAMLSEDEGRDGRLPGMASPPRSKAPGGHQRQGSSSDGNKPLPPVPGTEAPKGGTRDSALSGTEDWPAEALMHMGIAPTSRVKRKEVQR
jgi:hypothetical protein